MRLQQQGAYPLSTSATVRLLRWVKLERSMLTKVSVLPWINCLHYTSFTPHTVYNSLGYMEVVAEAAEASMNLAVREVKELPNYAECGEVGV